MSPFLKLLNKMAVLLLRMLLTFNNILIKKTKVFNCVNLKTLTKTTDFVSFYIIESVDESVADLEAAGAMPH